MTSLALLSRNITTIEDPIEYYIDGINQTQINDSIHMTFAKGLRAILRQVNIFFFGRCISNHNIIANTTPSIDVEVFDSRINFH
jgi:hypothetical protein